MLNIHSQCSCTMTAIPLVRLRASSTMRTPTWLAQSIWCWSWAPVSRSAQSSRTVGSSADDLAFRCQGSAISSKTSSTRPDQLDRPLRSELSWSTRPMSSLENGKGCLTSLVSCKPLLVPCPMSDPLFASVQDDCDAFVSRASQVWRKTRPDDFMQQSSVLSTKLHTAPQVSVKTTKTQLTKPGALTRKPPVKDASRPRAQRSSSPEIEIVRESKPLGRRALRRQSSSLVLVPSSPKKAGSNKRKRA